MLGRPLGNAEDWSDGNKLRLLADYLDQKTKTFFPNSSGDTVQFDLRRIADRLDKIDSKSLSEEGRDNE